MSKHFLSTKNKGAVQEKILDLYCLRASRERETFSSGENNLWMNYTEKETFLTEKEIHNPR